MRKNDSDAITLRQAEPNDEAFLYRLYASVRAEEMAAWGWDSAQQEAFLGLQFRGQQAHYREYPNTDHQIILADGRPIGRILVSDLKDEFRLVDIALLSEYRNAGIGAALIGELLRRAAQAGKAVRLHVEKTNGAQRLYQRLGFRHVSDTGSHYLMEWLDCEVATKKNRSGESLPMLDTLHYEDFASHINSRFRAQLSADSTMEMTLINVEDKSPSPRQEQFVLTFLAPREAPPLQGLYQLQHEQLGGGAVFLVPIARDENGLTYEAVFNRNRAATQ